MPLNKQIKIVNGQIVSRGVEWCHLTWNPIPGCYHRCEWVVGGKVVECYAKNVAEGVALNAYPNGFEHAYFFPERLAEPARVKTPSRIFVDSMGDLFGRWVETAQIEAVLDTARGTPQHTYVSLTKNPSRLLGFDYPKNWHAGVSMPPDRMWGHELKPSAQDHMFEHSLHILAELASRGVLTWVSAEPLSWDIAPILADCPGAIKWIVIGAGSDGPRYFQPERDHLAALLAECDRQQIPVFFKGNLAGNPLASPWREFYPYYVPTAWNTAPSPMTMQPIAEASHVY